MENWEIKFHTKAETSQEKGYLAGESGTFLSSYLRGGGRNYKFEFFLDHLVRPFNQKLLKRVDDSPQ